jgi:hypothetical protein
MEVKLHTFLMLPLDELLASFQLLYQMNSIQCPQNKNLGRLGGLQSHSTLGDKDKILVPTGNEPIIHPVTLLTKLSWLVYILADSIYMCS